MHKTTDRNEFATKVIHATISLIIDKGIRKLRTADIATAAGTTESTLFRHFEGMNDILAQTYDHTWAVINRHVAETVFVTPRAETSTQQLLGDMAALWSLRRDNQAAESTMLAFLFLRRRMEIVDDMEPAVEQQRFQTRIQSLVEQILREQKTISADEPEESAKKSPDLLTQMVMNYAATVWLTWFCMPINEGDVVGQHNLSEDEAQLGVLVLLEQFSGKLDSLLER